MASARGPAGTSLIEHLQQAPYQYDFFQAIRLLQLLAVPPSPDLSSRARPAGSGESARPSSVESESFPPSGDGAADEPVPAAPALLSESTGELVGELVGYDADPGNELVRLRGWAASQFPPAEICGLERRGTGGDGAAKSKFEMTVGFMGLYGPHGVLPPHYTQRVVTEVRHRRRHPQRDFLDLFNHRVLSLFYRAWEKYRVAVPLERARRRLAHSDEPQRNGRGDDDRFTRCLLATIGLASKHLRGRLKLDDDLLLSYAGAFSHFPRNWSSLERMLRAVFGLPIEVRQFQGSWLELSPADRTLMPSASHPRGLNNALGQATIVGERIWSIQHRFRIRIGPVGWREFRSFMPGAGRLVEIAQLVRQYVGVSLDFDVQVVLAKRDVPQLKLDRPGESEPNAGPRLGFSSWLISRPPDDDRDDAVFEQDGFPEQSDESYATPFAVSSTRHA